MQDLSWMTRWISGMGTEALIEMYKERAGVSFSKASKTETNLLLTLMVSILDIAK